MPIQKKQAKNGRQEKHLSGWDQVILEARRRIRNLRFTIKVYQERKARGEPWPGTQTQGSAGRQRRG